MKNLAPLESIFPFSNTRILGPKSATCVVIYLVLTLSTFLPFLLFEPSEFVFFSIFFLNFAPEILNPSNFNILFKSPLPKLFKK